jgi:hypothetical protein
MTEKPLGDRLTAAKLIIDALAASQVDAEQAERLLDALIPPKIADFPSVQWPLIPESSRTAQNHALSQVDDLDVGDHREDHPRTRDERNEAIEEELERIAATSSPPAAPGVDLTQDPESFVAKVSQAKLARLEMGTKHR